MKRHILGIDHEKLAAENRRGVASHSHASRSSAPTSRAVPSQLRSPGA